MEGVFPEVMSRNQTFNQTAAPLGLLNLIPNQKSRIGIKVITLHTYLAVHTHADRREDFINIVIRTFEVIGIADS